MSQLGSAAGDVVGASATVHPASSDPGPPIAGRRETYLRLARSWAVWDRVVLDRPIEVRITVPDKRIDAVRGCGAVEVGPLVYCFEDDDQPDGVSVDDILLDGATVRRRPELLGGVATSSWTAGGAMMGPSLPPTTSGGPGTESRPSG